jgi:hypothetical protein
MPLHCQHVQVFQRPIGDPRVNLPNLHVVHEATTTSGRDVTAPRGAPSPGTRCGVCRPPGR